jgi:hypothetical protein
MHTAPILARFISLLARWFKGNQKSYTQRGFQCLNNSQILSQKKPYSLVRISSLNVIDWIDVS